MEGEIEVVLVLPVGVEEDAPVIVVMTVMADIFDMFVFDFDCLGRWYIEGTDTDGSSRALVG